MEFKISLDDVQRELSNTRERLEMLEDLESKLEEAQELGDSIEFLISDLEL